MIGFDDQASEAVRQIVHALAAQHLQAMRWRFQGACKPGDRMCRFAPRGQTEADRGLASCVQVFLRGFRLSQGKLEVTSFAAPAGELDWIADCAEGWLGLSNQALRLVETADSPFQ